MGTLTSPSPGHLFVDTLVGCQGLVWLNREDHFNANEVLSVPGRFVFLQLKQ